MKCAKPADVVRFLEGDLESEEMAALAEHFRRCETCGRMRADVTDIGRRLGPDRGEFDSVDVAPDVLALIRAGRRHSDATKHGSGWSPRVAWRYALAVGLPLLSIAIATPVLLRLLEKESDQKSYLARGESGDLSDRWVSIHVFRKVPTGHEPVENQIAAHDRLAFAYENREAGRYAFLMILAVAERGQVFWYYPPYRNQQEDPESLSIQQTTGPLTLPFDVQHDLHPGPLRVFAVFSRTPLRVKQVETQVAADLVGVDSIKDLRRLKIADAGQHTLLLDVTEE